MGHVWGVRTRYSALSAAVSAEGGVVRAFTVTVTVWFPKFIQILIWPDTRHTSVRWRRKLKWVQLFYTDWSLQWAPLRSACGAANPRWSSRRAPRSSTANPPQRDSTADWWRPELRSSDRWAATKLLIVWKWVWAETSDCLCDLWHSGSATSGPKHRCNARFFHTKLNLNHNDLLWSYKAIQTHKSYISTYLTTIFRLLYGKTSIWLCHSLNDSL